MKRVEIEYEAPQDGWLPLKIWVDGQLIDIDASDVPNNPIQDLLEAIRLASRGDDAAVWWPLEPGAFIFDFHPQNDGFRLRIRIADNDEGARTREVTSTEGSAEEILLPFWRFLRDFQSRDYGEPHWPDIDYRDIESIGKTLKSYRR